MSITAFADSRAMEILLDLENHVFRPGDIVTGKLRLNVLLSSVRSARVTFEGRGGCAPVSSEGQCVAVNMLQHTIVEKTERQLIASSHVLQDNKELRFSFKFPSYAFGDRGLPPSYSRSIPSLTVEYMERYGVLITYFIEAEVLQQNWLHKRRVRKELVLRPLFTKFPNLTPQLESLEQKKCPGNWRSKANGFIWRKSNKHNEERALRVGMQLPPTLEGYVQDKHVAVPNVPQCQAYNLRRSAYFLMNGGDDLRFQKIKLTLWSITRTYDDNILEEKIGHTSFEKEAHDLRTVHSNGIVEIFARLNLDNFTQQESYLPDFTSSAPYVIHSHEIRVEVLVGGDDTSQNYRFKGKQTVAVLPPLLPGSDVIPGGGSNAQELWNEASGTQQLPLYTT